jgi:hypothetical protein
MGEGERKVAMSEVKVRGKWGASGIVGALVTQRADQTIHI